ncbi:hypothetical protein [Clostridium beijerinckii]|uniref:hypothetical protein n=1 Tax=Clostridium beijerinckii TaxID=1520 RepID=UPI001494E63A|nr:hypothetical protein [Clostridium beijerinckii]NOW04900.1 hypothetical protein [Clostridium beijerinckii]
MKIITKFLTFNSKEVIIKTWINDYKILGLLLTRSGETLINEKRYCLVSFD